MANVKTTLAVEVGQRIGTLRQNRNLTQEQLAEKIEKNAKYMTVLESGSKIMRIDTFVSICDALNADYTAVLTGSELSQRSKDAISRLNKLTQAEFEKLLEFLDEITKGR